MGAIKEWRCTETPAESLVGQAMYDRLRSMISGLSDQSAYDLCFFVRAKKVSYPRQRLLLSNSQINEDGSLKVVTRYASATCSCQTLVFWVYPKGWRRGRRSPTINGLTIGYPIRKSEFVDASTPKSVSAA